MGQNSSENGKKMLLKNPNKSILKKITCTVQVKKIVQIAPWAKQIERNCSWNKMAFLLHFT